jgi:hypothetical protein
MYSSKTMRQVSILLLTVALFLSSCNLGAATEPTTDINALSTAIVQTTIAQVSAQSTQTALAAPSNTPAVTNTAAGIELPTLDTSGTAASPTLDVASLPTFSFINTPIPSVAAGDTPTAGPTPVTLPSAAPTSALGDACNNSAFEGDITIPDGTVIKPGQDFQKIWAIRNTGSCTWDEGYTLVYIGGSTPDLDPYNFEFKLTKDFVPGGGAVNIAINLTAPCKPGKYEGHWRMRNDHGYFFGTLLSVYIEVKESCK